MGIFIAVGGWIAALGVAEDAAQLLSFYDLYSVGADLTGSSMFIDFTLQMVESFFNHIVLTTIGAGGYIVGIFILGQELNFSQAVSDLVGQVASETQKVENAAKSGV